MNKVAVNFHVYMLVMLGAISDPCKYFGCELGAQVQFDAKNDRFIVNGSHEASKLQDLLDGFIRKFVLCQGCDNPETKLVGAGVIIGQKHGVSSATGEYGIRTKCCCYRWFKRKRG